MKSKLIVFILSLVLITSLQKTVVSSAKPTQELRLQDMLMNMLAPYIEKDLNNYYYPKILRDFSPQVTPWNIEVIETRKWFPWLYI